MAHKVEGHSLANVFAARPSAAHASSTCFAAHPCDAHDHCGLQTGTRGIHWSLPLIHWITCRIRDWTNPKPKSFVSDLGLGPTSAHLGPGPLGSWAAWTRAHLGMPTCTLGPLGPWATWTRARLSLGPTWAHICDCCIFVFMKLRFHGGITESRKSR